MSHFQGFSVQSILGEIPVMWIVVSLFVLVLLVGSLSKLPGVKGRIGEGIVNRAVLGRLDRTRYSVFHDLYLPRPDGRGDTQIDHIVVSQFGIFVIETKNMTGWIFGDETSRSWTQTIYRKKYRFQNPLHQNALHIGALSKHLGLPRSQFHNLVFFIGDAELKTKLPANVATRGFRALICKHETPVLSAEVVERINLALSDIQSKADKSEAKRAHVSNCKQRSMSP